MPYVLQIIAGHGLLKSEYYKYNQFFLSGITVMQQ